MNFFSIRAIICFVIYIFICITIGKSAGVDGLITLHYLCAFVGRISLFIYGPLGNVRQLIKASDTGSSRGFWYYCNYVFNRIVIVFSMFLRISLPLLAYIIRYMLMSKQPHYADAVVFYISDENARRLAHGFLWIGWYSLLWHIPITDSDDDIVLPWPKL